MGVAVSAGAAGVSVGGGNVAVGASVGAKAGSFAALTGKGVLVGVGVGAGAVAGQAVNKNMAKSTPNKGNCLINITGKRAGGDPAGCPHKAVGRLAALTLGSRRKEGKGIEHDSL